MLAAAPLHALWGPCGVYEAAASLKSMPEAIGLCSHSEGRCCPATLKEAIRAENNFDVRGP